MHSVLPIRDNSIVIKKEPVLAGWPHMTTEDHSVICPNNNAALASALQIERDMHMIPVNIKAAELTMMKRNYFVPNISYFILL